MRKGLLTGIWTVSVLLIYLATVFAPVVQAQQASNEWVQRRNEACDAAREQGLPNLECQGDTNFNVLLTAANCGMIGGAINCSGNIYNSSPNVGAVGFFSSSIASIYKSKPASTDRYVADLLNSANIATPAYAQGIGFASLSPILDTWKMFRNLAYLFFVLIFLVIGFMIMFRQKVGQTAVTAQQAIPSIIVALLAVTFSYAIAGLLIDAMYWIMFIMVGIFGQSTNLVDKNIIQLGFYMVTKGFRSVDVIGDLVDSTLESLTDILAEPAEIVSEAVMLFVISLAILIGIFGLFMELLKTYISIVLNIAFAPIILMMGAIPGRNTFWPWLKSLIGNLAAFPTVLMVLIVYDRILDIRGPINDGGFLPPYLLGSGAGSVLPALLGFGLLLSLRETVSKTRKAFGAGDGVIGELITTGVNNLKPALPLGGRIGGMVVGGGAVGLYNGAQEFRAARGMPLGDRLRWAVGDSQNGVIGGFKRGTGYGVTAASRLSRTLGANQPDLFNPVTNYIDQKIAPEEAKKTADLQRAEDIAKIMSQYLNRSKP